MQNDYERLFRSLNELEPSDKLYRNIFAGIEIKRCRIIRIQFAFLGSAIFTSFIALIPAFQYTIQEFYQSGFYQYFSLIFSDGGTLILYWQEFVLSLAESLPLLGITAVLGIIFVLLGLFKIAVQNARILFPSIKFIN